MEKKFKFHTPLMFLTKAQTWKLSYTIGGEKFINIIKISLILAIKEIEKNYLVGVMGVANVLHV